MPSPVQEHDTSAGAGYYSPLTLKIYDALVLGAYCNYAWECPTETFLLPLFQRNVNSSTSRALDIGVGTGFYTSKASLPADATVTLVDLNKNSLDTAAKRTLAAHPRIHCHTAQADFFSPEEMSAERIGGDYDSISLMFLLHCLPGPPAQKAAAMVRLRHLLKKDGVLFGATVLGQVQHNLLGRFIMRWHNSWGVFNNVDDGADSFVAPLEEAFESVVWEVHGKVLCFEAKRPRF